MYKKALATRQSLFRQYSNPIPNFIDYPRGFLPLDVIHKICFRRVKLYYLLGSLSLTLKLFDDEWKTTLLTELKKEFPDDYNVCCSHEKTIQVLKAHHYDRIARFIMFHIAAKKESNDIREWIIDNEITLFQLRFDNLPIEIQEEFLLKEKLISKSSEKLEDIDGNKTFTYEVSWKHVTQLIAERRIPLIKGKSYIKQCHFSIVASNFQRIKVQSSLINFKIGLSVLTIDPRMNDILIETSQLINQYKRKVYQRDWLDKMDGDLARFSLSEASMNFPPCMEKIHCHLETHSHIPYDARVQFIPFLKDIGLSVDDISFYFKSQFLKKISEKEYKKKRYDYEIRYSFGLEGSRHERFSKNCINIIKKTEECSKSCFGCPLLSKESMKTILHLPSFSHFTTAEKNYILSFADNMSSTILCAEILKFKNSSEVDVIVNPIQYYGLNTLNDLDE